MAAKIQIKRASSATDNTVSNLGNLSAGELAVSYGNAPAHDNSGGRLFVGNSSGGGNIVIGGEYFTNLLDHAPGSLQASSSLITNSSSALEQLKVDNLDLNGNSITSTDTNGDINITPNGTGDVVIDGLKYPQADGSADQFLKTDGSGQLSFATVVSNFTVSDNAGTPNTTSFDTGDTLKISGGTNITSTLSDSGTTTTVTLDVATATTSDLGVASFATADFGVTSGAVSLNDAVVKTVTTDSGAMTPSSHGFSVLGGEGMNVTHSGTTITVAGELATTGNVGSASFAAADFAVSGAGEVTIHSVSNAQLAGNIANAKLVNDGITIGSDDTSLGDTITDLNGLTSVDVDNLTIDGNTISVTNTDGNLVLTPNGTGTVTVPTGYKDRSGFTANSLATKAYVDATKSGLDIKDSVKLATTAALATLTYSQANGTLTGSGNGSINASSGLGQSVTLAANDRVLVKDQAESRQNGIYVVTTVGGSESFVLTRADDANSGTNFTGGSFVFVEQGTNANNGYVFTHDDEPTLTNATLSNNTQLPVSQFSGAGQIVAGDGLTKSANTINAVGTSNRISVSANAIDISTSYVGQTSITTLGTITTGTWNGSTLGSAYGGTGLTAAAKGSVLVANTADTFSALDGGGSTDKILFYNQQSDTITWESSLDAGTF